MKKEIIEYLIKFEHLEQVDDWTLADDFIEVRIIEQEKGVFIAVQNIEVTNEPLFSFWAGTFGGFKKKWDLLNNN